MRQKRYLASQIIVKFRQVESDLGSGKTISVGFYPSLVDTSKKTDLGLGCDSFEAQGNLAEFIVFGYKPPECLK